ncbi:hydrolase [Vibrio inusitatus NBRC 102082]|uniref:Hydrolase n=1 Tax=Vibrio inusitatus NBRC 102082 TaxID=1219070 RepID=A0A4Y3HT68_9VIBR|nr:alpha/beta hydrolase [Vibrio inusitatus]GEA49504.1 hydrolase [Vibrio inusitatus NBRC 102082]
MLSERTFEVSDYSLSALCHESQGASNCILMLHGWLDNAASFTPLMEEISAKNPDIQLIALDLPGHGYSSHSHSGYYPFHDYIDSLHQVISQINNECDCPLTLVGHSMGALIASCYSAAFPENVGHLVQIEGYGPIYESPQNSLSRLRKGVLSRQRVSKKPPRFFESFDEMVQLRARRYVLNAEEITPLVERDSEQTEHGWHWRHDKKLKAESLYRMTEAQAKQVIEALPKSNLLILGDTGFTHLSSICTSTAQILHIKGGHHCHLSCPRSISEAIIALILFG